MTNPERKLLIIIARVVVNLFVDQDRKEAVAIRKLIGMVQREAAIKRD